MTNGTTSASSGSLYAESQRLKAEAQGLLVEFLRLDIEIAQEFLASARFQSSAGNAERTERLISSSKQAARAIAAFLNRLPDSPEAERLRRQLADVQNTIRDTEESCEILAAR